MDFEKLLSKMEEDDNTDNNEKTVDVLPKKAIRRIKGKKAKSDSKEIEDVKETKKMIKRKKMKQKTKPKHKNKIYTNLGD